MNATQTAAKAIWKSEFRAFRMAQQTPIMSENGIAIRLDATSRMRKLTGKWDLPLKCSYPSTMSIPHYRRHEEYKPSLAFRRFLKAC